MIKEQAPNMHMKTHDMDYPRITYSVRPSFEGDIDVEMNWNSDQSRYDVHIKEGVSKRHITVSLDQVQELLAAIATLQLSAPKKAVWGLDGTTFSLTIGLGLSTKMIFTWWSEIPEAWSDLKPIVKRIEQLADVDSESPPPMFGERQTNGSEKPF